MAAPPIFDNFAGRYTLTTHAVSRSCYKLELTKTNLYFHACCQVEFHKGIHCFFCGLHYVQQTLMGTNLVLITGVFVNVRRNQHGKFFLSRGQGDRSFDLGASATRCLYDLLGG